MFRVKIFLSIMVFISLLVCTSVIKNETRDIEKKIYDLVKIIDIKEKDLNESQLDFSYLTSPAVIEKKIEYLDRNQYQPMEYSKIFLSMSSFLNLQNKFVTQEKKNEKKK
tara:strand:+ start:421 stop:750 length:330 start_codon:yes stop_codon:yes gene_type:complete